MEEPGQGRAVDYLAGRPEVDPQRLGCCGLSGGGLRTVYLAGLDPRVKCGICVGFMTVAREVLEEKIVEHTWMFHVPHLSRLMEDKEICAACGMCSAGALMRPLRVLPRQHAFNLRDS